jgi:hypothetical protein
MFSNDRCRHWFYEDFIRESNPQFPSLPQKKFSEMLFQACPLIKHWSGDFEQAFDNFMLYKTRVPVCGAIMLNAACDKVAFCLSTSHAGLHSCPVRSREGLEVIVRVGLS